MPTSDGVLLVDGDLKFYDHELAHEYLKQQQSVSFWHTHHEQIASIVRSSLQSYGIQMGTSFVSSFKANISLQSLHQAFQLAIDIKNNEFVALVKKFMTLGFKGKLALLFQINDQEVTPDVCTSLYVEAIVAKYQTETLLSPGIVPVTSTSSQTPTKLPAIKNEHKLKQPKVVQMPSVIGLTGVFVPKVSKKAPQKLKSITMDNITVSFNDKNELYFFIRKKNPKAIEMINNGYTLTEPDDNGYFPIHHAAQYGNNEAIQVMLEKGINVNILTRNSDKLTPLHVAANLGQTVVVETLLAAGANIEASTTSGLTPVRLASNTNHADVVKVLLSNGALTNACDKDRVTSLHVAAHHGNVRVVELLLEHGANALCHDSREETPFQLVLASKNDTLLKVFLQKRPKLLESANHLSNPPLLECCLNGGDIKMIEVMLEHGANPNEVHPKEEASPLHAACELDRVDLIEIFMKHRADPTLCFPTIGTPLHHAVWMGNIRAVRKLIQLNVSPNLMNAQNISPLAKALINEQYEIAQLLIDSGADVNQMATPKPGMIVYPIHMAVMRKHYKILTSIVNHNGAIDATNNEGNTALHLAVFRFQNDMVEFLCQKGANVNIQNIGGTTPLIGGVIKKNESAVMTLLNYEADINLVDNFQDSALSYAFIKQMKSVVDFLLNLGATFDVLNGKGLAAFHRACRFGDVSQVAFMLTINPDVLAFLNASSIDPQIHYALENPPVLAFLLEHGENPNILVNNNDTYLPVLYDAIFGGYIESTQILLTFGADPSIDFLIGSALQIAVSSPYATDELLASLLNAGVKMLLGPDNVTPLLIAAEQNFCYSLCCKE